MTKAELIAVVGEKAGLTKKDADVAVTAVIDAITETLAKGEKVRVKDPRAEQGHGLPCPRNNPLSHNLRLRQLSPRASQGIF